MHVLLSWMLPRPPQATKARPYGPGLKLQAQIQQNFSYRPKMHTNIGSVSPYYGQIKASSQEFKSVSVSAVTVLVIFQCHNSKMVFVHRNTRSLTDQVKSSFWLVWLAYKGLRAIGKRASFSTDRMVVLVTKGSVYIMIWGQTIFKYFTRTTTFFP